MYDNTHVLHKLVSVITQHLVRMFVQKKFVVCFNYIYLQIEYIFEGEHSIDLLRRFLCACM